VVRGELADATSDLSAQQSLVETLNNKMAALQEELQSSQAKTSAFSHTLHTREQVENWWRKLLEMSYVITGR